MTKITKKVAAKVVAAKDKAVDAKRTLKFSLFHAFDGLLIIWAVAIVSFISLQVFTPENFKTPSVGLWSTISLIISSLFIVIHSRFKK